MNEFKTLLGNKKWINFDKYFNAMAQIYISRKRELRNVDFDAKI